MPATVRCPHCDESIRVQDHEGPRVECPSCGTRFERPQGRAGYALPADEGDIDLGQSPRLEHGTLPLLMRGSLLQIIANALHLLAFLLVGILAVNQLDRPGGPRPEKFSLLLVLTTAGCLLAVWFLNLIAAAFWAMAPAKGISRALGLAVLCLCLLVVWRGSEFLGLIGGPMGGDGRFDDPFERRSPAGMLFVLYYLDVVRMMVFAGYLVSVARETGRKSAHNQATMLAVFVPLFLLGPVVLLMLASLVDVIGTELRLLFLMMMAAGTLAAVAWTLAVVIKLRSGWGRAGRLTRDD
jgi:hypothetical protein